MLENVSKKKKKTRGALRSQYHSQYRATFAPRRQRHNNLTLRFSKRNETYKRCPDQCGIAGNLMRVLSQLE